MAKKLQWNRNYSESYLVDRELNKLSFAQHGLLKIINDILWTQTDEPGKYIIKGRPGTLDELLADTKRYAHGSMRDRRRTTDRHLGRFFNANLLAHDEHQTIYSPFILKEIKKHEDAVTRGKKGGSPLLNPQDNPQDNQGVKPREDKRERRGEENKKNIIFQENILGKSFQNNPPTRFRLRDYQNEVLNKLEGHPHNSDHPAIRVLYRIAEYVPENVVHAALEATQDQRLRNLSDSDNHNHNLTAYYLATVRNMCHEKGIQTEINWKETNENKEAV